MTRLTAFAAFEPPEREISAALMPSETLPEFLRSVRRPPSVFLSAVAVTVTSASTVPVISSAKSTVVVSPVTSTNCVIGS